MKVIFLQPGDSPDIGPFTEGDVRDISDPVAIAMIERGLAVQHLSNPSDGPDPSDDFDLQEVK